MEKEGKDKKKNSKKKVIINSILLLLLVIVAAGLIIYYYNLSSENSDDNTLSYTDLIKEISYGNVENIEMTVGSTTVKVKLKNEEDEKTTIVPNTEAFISLIQEKVDEGNEIRTYTKSKKCINTNTNSYFKLNANNYNDSIICNDI